MTDTKSRYEVIAELEEQKRDLISERESFADKIRREERNIRDAERRLSDGKEDLEEFKKSVEDRKTVIKELIASVDDSLKRFAALSKA